MSLTFYIRIIKNLKRSATDAVQFHVELEQMFYSASLQLDYCTIEYILIGGTMKNVRTRVSPWLRKNRSKGACQMLHVTVQTSMYKRNPQTTFFSVHPEI